MIRRALVLLVLVIFAGVVRGQSGLYPSTAASDFVVFPLGRTDARLNRISVQSRRFRLQSSPWYEIVAASALPASSF